MCFGTVLTIDISIFIIFLNIVDYHGSRVRRRRRAGLETKIVQVGFVVDEVTLGQVFLRVLRVLFVSIIPPMLYIHLHIQNYF
jgi:hypothetical protein